MESRVFIKSAIQLIADIQKGESDPAELQREVSRLFVGLGNPTLPSALKLRDVALRNGLSIAPGVQQRLHQGEGIWSFSF